jgi:REP element-mobilizing transposase RayT
MDRFWFLTWRTYGTWLPGDERGFVDPVVDEDGKRVIHNVPGTPLDKNNSRLREYSRSIMKGEPVYLATNDAGPLLQQFQETARYRGWRIIAVAVLTNHVHLIVGVPGDPDSTCLLRDFKSYGSRALSKHAGKPTNGSWWAESGSRRILKTQENLEATIRYVLNQDGPLLIWCDEEYQPAHAGRSPDHEPFA